MNRLSHNRLFRAASQLAVTFGVLLVASPAFAASAGGSGLGGLVDKLEQFNTELVSIGGVLAVTGFIWAMASMLLGLAGAARAVMVLAAGLAVASAPQIVSFFTGV